MPQSGKHPGHSGQDQPEYKTTNQVYGLPV